MEAVAVLRSQTKERGKRRKLLPGSWLPSLSIVLGWFGGAFFTGGASFALWTTATVTGAAVILIILYEARRRTL